MAIETPQFGGFLGGWLGAQDRRQQIAERERQTAAYNALVADYGAVAGDPVAYGQLAGIRRSEEAHPLEQQARGLANESVGETLRQSRELFPLTKDRAALGNTQLGQTIDQSAAAFPLEQRARQQGITSTDAALGDNDRARSIQALARGVKLLTAVRESGGDLAYAFDKLLPTLGAMGIPSDQIAQARTAIVSDPAALDQIAAALGGAVDEKGKPLVAGAGKGEQQGLTEGMKYQQREIGKRAAKAEDEAFDVEAQGVRTAEDVAARVAPTVGKIDKLLKNTKNAFGISSVLGYVASTDVRSAQNDLTALKDDLALTALANLKQLAGSNGASGLGALSTKEAERLENQLGKLDPYDSEEHGKQVLGEIREQLAGLPARLQAAAKRDADAARAKAKALYDQIDQGGGAQRTSSSGGYDLDDAAVAGQPEGTVVEDEQGQRYVVRGGQLVPQ